MSAANYKAIIEKVNAGFEKNNPEVFLDNCTENVKWTMTGDDTRTGKQSIRDFVKDMGDFKLEKLSTDKIIAEGDSAAAYGEMTMNEKGEKVNYSFCDVYTFEGEKISELRSFAVKQKAVGKKDKSATA
ncbi:MAG TPA: nuclear transport factor 2 family protein [Pyrinomonadaceae bacterium]|nr:nuclear transport factor 2 family protein [Pyrinomonadaceae bacterium]